MANTKLATGCRAVDLTIIAQGSTWLTAAELAAVRQQSLDRFPTPLRPQFLKHSDEQTLAALTALNAAIQTYDVGCDFHNWAIVSSTRYLGRAAFAAVIDKYQVDGPWGVSVQVIPHTAPHAVAGTASLALGCHGPSIGAGAAPGEESQALLTAATLLQTPDVGGAWILLTGWSTDEGTTETACAPRCAAAALAVVNPRLAGYASRSLGRIVVEASRPQPAEAWRHGERAAVPLTELLSRQPAADLYWGRTCRGMHTRLELHARGMALPQPRLLRAA